MDGSGFRFGCLALIGGLLLTGVAQAQTGRSDDKPKAEAPAPSRWGETRKRALDIGAQPVRDVGVMRREAPAILEQALADPYSLKGLKTCTQLAAEVRRLNEALGADFIVGNEVKESRVGKLAEAGGKTVINSIIPFRGLVREISGAAPAERHLDAALDAGLARRGFLRGVHYKQGCKTKF
ncbi:hypothetical protein [Caulobacter henricii]|uniref:Uncharacterized protein n=1 Tax=Caulobacter henricii TaxID=69395 RepID=A0A0N7JH56_9CAUL|nr:hypothetical protein [Caulobacter henricii]ALL12458.1 hypothetical protein AQ619_03310 [Caulobacter henricii]